MLFLIVPTSFFGSVLCFFFPESCAVSVSTASLLFFYMMNGISSFFSQTSMSTAVAFGLLIVAIAIIIYTMIKNVLISAVIGVVGEK